jgi:hypothetical protein
MKKSAIIFFILTICTGVIFSQTVNICGRVVDENGNPLTNTLIRLCQTRYSMSYGPQPYYTTTDASGQYKLGTGNCVVNVIKESSMVQGKAFSQPIYLGGKVLFSVPQDRALVKISIHNLSGRFIKEIINNSYSKGNYSVSIDISNLSSQFYLLKVTINNISSVVMLQAISNGSSKTIVKKSPEIKVSLEKLAAVIDTLRATEPGYTLGVKPIEALEGQYDFVLKKNHTWNGDKEAFWDTAHAKKEPGRFWYTIINRTNGAYADSQIYWAIGDFGAPHRLSEERYVDLTSQSSGRLYVMLGSSTRGRNAYWDFEEHTNGNGWFHGNTTRVDQYGIPISYRLHCLDGFDTCRGELYHVFFQSRQSFFEEYLNEVPPEWTHLGTIQAPYRIPNPGAGEFRSGGKYANYWSTYGPNPYTTNLGPQPSAASNRHVIGLTTQQQADDKYHYKETPCNFYSYFLHRRAIDRKCYGFPYDDYANWSSYIEHGNVSWLILAVGY